MIKKFYLYRETLTEKGKWYFDDEFEERATAENIALENSRVSSWRKWKIEEVLLYEPEE